MAHWWRCQFFLVVLVNAAAPARHITMKEFQQRPFCNTSSPVPPVSGYMSQDNLVLDAGCRYTLFESANAAKCLSGTWILIMGSSNTLLEFNNIINFFAPSEYFIDRTGELIGVSSVVDVMIQDRKVIHWKTMDANEPDCKQLNLKLAEQLRPRCAQAMGAMFGDAPAHSADVIRITFITTFFWYRADLAVDVVSADAAWKDAKLSVIAQVGAWYMYCSIIKFKYCTRKELIPLNFYGRGLKLYTAEMKSSLQKMEPICNSGRAQCYVQTVSWSNGKRDNKAYRAMNVFVRQQMVVRATPSFRLVDFYRLGEVMPEEVVEGHGSQLLNLWMWTVMFNGLCPAELAAQKPQAVFSGTMCTAAELSYSKCPQYHKLCKSNVKKFGGPVCMNWACLNSVPCNLSTRLLDEDQGGLCEDEMLESPITGGQKAAVATSLQWILPLVTMLALGLKLLLHAPGATTPDETEKPLTFRESPRESRPPEEQGRSESTLLKAEAAENPLPDESSRMNPMTSALIGLPKAGHRFVMGPGLFLASTHLALNQAFQQGLVAPLDFYGWGEVWIPWLIMVTGFMLFASELRSFKEETMTAYLHRCPSTFFFYPLYAFGLLVSFILAKLSGADLTGFTLVAQAFLMQSWIPGLESQLQPNCWFLSCLAVYWILFKFIASEFKQLTLVPTISWMIVLLLLPWPLLPWAWTHHLARSDLSDLALNLGVGWEHHPISHVHVFLLGMLLANLRKLLDAQAVELGASWANPYVVAVQVLAPVGLLGLVLVQNLQAFVCFKPLLLFQVFILSGLVGLPSLPLPYVAYGFSKLSFLEDYWWALLVTSPCLLVLWPGGNAVLLLLFLYSSTFVLADSIQRPIQRWWASNPPRIWLAPVVLAILLLMGSLVGRAAVVLPAFVAIEPDIVDVFLKVEGDASSVVNPSVLVRPEEGEVMLLAQKQSVSWSRRSGIYSQDGEVWQAVILEETIDSDLVMGVQPLSPSGNTWRNWKNEKQSPLPAFPVKSWTGLRTVEQEAWTDLCVSESWFPANRTLLRRVVRGPEAGKLVSTKEKELPLLVFQSSPPRGVGDTCPSEEDIPVIQMYLAVSVNVSKPDAPLVANRLDYGFFNAEEKNWIPFTYDQRLHFVYPPVPHVIVSAHNDGSSQRLFSTTYLPLHRLRQKAPHVQIRGSGQGVLIDRPDITLNLPRKHYVALIHIFDNGHYTNYAYRFQPEPPFMMLQVSAPLPFTTAVPNEGGPAMAVASGLAVYDDTVLVSYTAGRREARALVMSLSQLDEFFTCGADSL